MSSFKWFGSFLGKHRGKMIVGLSIILVVSAMSVINPKVSGFIIDNVIVGGKL